jgi:hypothetical protein
MPPKKRPFSTLSRTAKYYRKNKRARAVKKKTDTEINKRKEQIKKRVEANRYRAQAKKKGKDIKDKDYDHAVKRFVNYKKNRGRKGEGNRKKK